MLGFFISRGKYLSYVAKACLETAGNDEREVGMIHRDVCHAISDFKKERNRLLGKGKQDKKDKGTTNITRMCDLIDRTKIDPTEYGNKEFLEGLDEESANGSVESDIKHIDEIIVKLEEAEHKLKDRILVIQSNEKLNIPNDNPISRLFEASKEL